MRKLLSSIEAESVKGMGDRAIIAIMVFTFARVSAVAALDRRDYTKVEIAGLYWHFVDIVWIAIFTIVYLIP